MRGYWATVALLPLLAFAQGDKGRITFDLIGLDKGLPHAQTDCFLEDMRGNLWVGMQQGLAVYDGSAFIPVDLQADGAPIGVRSMTLDHEGIIWVAAEQGPVRVDPISRKAELLDIPDSLRFGVRTLWVHSVAVTRPGELLFGANQTTFFLDTRTRRFKGLRSSSGEIVRTFWRFMHADTARQGVWISTHQWGLVFYHAPTGKLYEKDGDRSISPLIGEHVISLCDDGNGGLWCSHRRSGNLCHWDGHSQQFRTWDHVPGDTTLKVSTTWFLGRDRQGRIWGSGAFMFNPGDSTATSIPSGSASTGALPHGSIFDLYESGNGELWFGNILGIAVHDPVQAQPQLFEVADRKRSPAAPRIYSLDFSGDSVLWCAMGDLGLVRVDLRANSVRTVPFDGLGMEQPFVWDVLPVRQGVLIACESDVLMLDPRTLRCKKVNLVDEDESPLAPGRRWLAANVDGTIWMGLDLVRVVRFDPSTGKAALHIPDSTKEGALRYDNAYGAVSMKDGRTWMGGNLFGLTYWDEPTSKWVDLRSDVEEGRLRVGRIIGLAASSDSVLWLSTDGAGLVRYSIPTGTYTHYGPRHGITELGLYTIAVDGRGRIWTNSDERVFCFDPVTERAMVVDPRSSTGGDAAKWVLAISPGDALAMSMGREVAVFDAHAVISDRVPPAPVLTHLLVDGTAIDAGSEATISMNHDHEQLEVHFGAMLPPGYIKAFAMRTPGKAWSEYKEGRVILRGLRPGEHAFEFRLMNKEGAWGPATTLRVDISPPWWQTLVARILFAVALAAGIVLVFRARLNWVRKRERAQEEQARHMNELKLQALRAQMDPHFIFNCLNSIDSFIIANDREMASHYLGRFAKLIRLILQHSDSTRVPLEREVEMLRYYLELEALRFKYPFTFSVTIDEELEGEPVELPTMLVQPYIENAIWHGLRHKESAGHISVGFKLHDDQLECTVQDNGIGREASRELNKERSGVHRSMGMQVSADRLRIYDELQQGASRVEVHDLKNADGSACGTRVLITIPLLGKEHET